MKEQNGENETLLDRPERNQPASSATSSGPSIRYSTPCVLPHEQRKRSSRTHSSGSVLIRVLVEVYRLPAAAAMHGRPDASPRTCHLPRRSVDDARGQATVSLPQDAYPPRAELAYALHAIDGASGVRVVAGLSEGRFTIATDEPRT